MNFGRTLAFAAGALAAVSSAAFAQFGIPPTEGTRRRPEIASAPPIEWVEKLDEAVQRARRLGRPLFVFFHGSLKGSRLMEVGTVNTPEVQLRATRFVCTQLDPEADLETAKRFGLTVSQGIVIAEAGGKLLAKLEGNPRVEEIDAAMDAALKEFGPVPTEADLRALDELLARARRERSQKQISQAAKTLERMIKTKARCESVLQAQAELDEIVAEGARAVEEAKALAAAGRATEAAVALREIAKTYEKLPPGERAREELAALGPDRPREPDPAAAARARRLLDAAASARARGRLDEEVEALTQAAGLLSGEERARAESRLAEIRSDPELAARLASQTREREAKALLAKAKSWINNRSPEKARGFLEELAARYAELPQAEEARELLKGLGE